MTRPLFLFVAAVLFVSASRPAAAQYAHPLFILTIRDPGPPDMGPTARSLALGGARSISGRADDAQASPDRLVFGSGTDIVISGGMSSYDRDEPVKTPGASDQPTWVPTASSGTAVGYAAIARRWPRWALAGFYDATARYTHAFDTAEGTVYFAALYGTFIDVTATGRASVSESITRVGGTLAVAPISNRVGVGFSVYGVRFDYRAAAHTDESYSSSFAGGPVGHSVATDDQRAAFLGWGPGWVAGVSVKPLEPLTLSARYQHEPRFASALTFAFVDPRSPSSGASDIQFQLPSSWALSAALTERRTLVVVEFVNIMYADVFQPTDCLTPTTVRCLGWGLQDYSGGYRTADSSLVRAGVEQTVALRAGLLHLRGGAALAQGYTLVASDTVCYPPPVSAPRERVETATFGAGYEWRSTEVAAGVSIARGQTRVLVDFCVRIP